MNIKNFLHTAILVSNIEQSEYFYSEILGLLKVERDLNFKGIWYEIEGIQIHLIENPNFKNQVINEEKLGQNYHFALNIDNLDQFKEHLKKYNYSFQMSASGRKALFIKDPDYNIIEISQV